MMGGLCINATLLYSELNILCGVIMLIIAINLSISGFDKSEENRIFSYSVYLAAFANICDFLWNLCLTGTVNLPVMAMYLIDFFYFSLINFPIFNVADIYVTLSAIALILVIFFYYKEEDYAVFFSSKKSKE